MFEISTSAICRNGYDYNELVTEVQDYLIENEIFVPRWQREPLEVETFAFHANVLRALKALGFYVTEEDRQAVAQEVAKRIVGMGVLQPFLEHEGVEEGSTAKLAMSLRSERRSSRPQAVSLG